MTILNLLIYPNPILKEKAKEITEITSETKKLSNDMLETMYYHNGIGLAANQIGVLQRIFVLDLQENDKKNPIVFINPKIIKSSEEQGEEEEGCLSLPNLTAKVKRPLCIELVYQDLEGTTKKLKTDGMLSICIQHEIDHLNGIMFIDNISPLKRTMLLNKYKKYLKSQASN